MACRVLDPAVRPEVAYSDCYDAGERGTAERVMLASLTLGDTVLTSTAEGLLGLTLVIANQHASVDTISLMLVVRTSDGSVLSLTPDHAIFAVDGTLVAASDLWVGSSMINAAGKRLTVDGVDTMHAAIINPVTASGTLLVSDAGEPVLAASHPIWMAPMVLHAPTARTLVNVALLLAGDADRIDHGVAFALARLIAATGVLWFGMQRMCKRPAFAASRARTTP